MIASLVVIYTIGALFGLPVVSFLCDADDAEIVFGRALLWPAFFIKFLVNVIRKDLFS